MPIIANAAKALRKDRRRTVVNRRLKQSSYTIIKKLTQSKDASLLPQTYSSIDKAAKKNLIHKNKAARLKSQMARMVSAKS